MTDSPQKVFIDSNMLIFAANFQKENVLEWMDNLYENIYIHIEVYNELLTSAIKNTVVSFVTEKQWLLFDPADSSCLTKVEQEIYRNRLTDVKEAFREMNLTRIGEGKRLKTVSNFGEIATITACLMVNARVICSNDFDIRMIAIQEDYRVLIDNQEVLLVQDSAEDFCVYCYQNEIASRKSIRSFYKSIIFESHQRQFKLEQLDKRLAEVEG